MCHKANTVLLCMPESTLMDFRQLWYFVAVAEEGQFTRAASRVSVAQPAVSAQIRRLEVELEEPLFHRGPRAVALTAAGEALLPHARAVLAAAETGRDAIASLRGLLHGRLRIGVAGPLDHRLVEALVEFHRAHPAVEIVLTAQHNEPLLEALDRGDTDVGLIGAGVHPLPPQVSARVVDTEPLVVGVRPGHPLSRRKTVKLDELRNEPIITLIHGSVLRTVLEAACEKAGFAPRITAETGELGSVVELAAEGLGVAVVPRSAVEGTDVAVVRITRPRCQRRTALAWNQASLCPAGRAFLTLANTRFESRDPQS
jgi:DNA-binding transcriptional LysR family regulator